MIAFITASRARCSAADEFRKASNTRFALTPAEAATPSGDRCTATGDQLIAEREAASERKSVCDPTAKGEIALRKA